MKVFVRVFIFSWEISDWYDCQLILFHPQIWLLQLQHFLPVKSLSSKTVGRRSSLSLEGFLRDYFLPGTPVVISDCMADWPAKSKWNNMNYLKKIAGFRTIPVEVIIFQLVDSYLISIFVYHSLNRLFCLVVLVGALFLRALCILFT